MKRRITLLVLLSALVAACGGGGGDDDDRNSGPAASGGGAGAAAAAVATPLDAAAMTPAGGTPPPAAPFAPMPDTAAATGLRALVESEFDDPLRAPFIVESLGNGTVTAVENGRFSVTPADGAQQPMLAKSIPDIAAGVIETEVSISGEGAGGVTIRMRRTPQGTFVGYVCWIAMPDRAGCSFSDKDVFESLFVAAPGVVQVGESNRLRAAMIDDQLQLEVNGVVVGRVTETRNVNGKWGVYAESFAGGTATTSFERITIFRVFGAYALP
jgi:hypothetical protein